MSKTPSAALLAVCEALQASLNRSLHTLPRNWVQRQTAFYIAEQTSLHGTSTLIQQSSQSTQHPFQHFPQIRRKCVLAPKCLHIVLSLPLALWAGEHKLQNIVSRWHHHSAPHSSGDRLPHTAHKHTAPTIHKSAHRYLPPFPPKLNRRQRQKAAVAVIVFAC